MPPLTFAYTYTDPLLPLSDRSFEVQPIDRLYHDLGGRQQLEQLLQDCWVEDVLYVLVRRLEELGDSIQEVQTRLEQFEQAGVSLIVIELWRSEVLQGLAALQANLRRQQLQRGHAQNRLKALPPPGKAPYGYRRGKERYALDRSTAPVVKDFFEHFLLYGSLRGSVRYLHKKYNKRISVSTGQRWLTSPVYRGDLEYATGEVIPDTHVPILSRDEAAQVDRLLRRNRRMPPRTASAPRSLSGLVQCGTCQAPLTISRVKTGDKEYLYLRSTSCSQQPKCRALPYETVLQRTIEQVCQDLPPTIAGLTLPDMEGIRQGLLRQMDDKQAIVQQLPELVRSGVLDQETADLRRYKLQTEVAQLQKQLAQLPPQNLRSVVQVVSIPQFWLDLSEAERRFYFREFIQRVEIVREGATWRVAIGFIF